MFWKVIVSVAFVAVLLTPGKALAAQYPPTTNGGTTTTKVGGTTTTKVGGTTTTKVGGTTTTTKVGGTTTTVKKVVKTVPPKPIVKARSGKLARTGAGDLATAVRIGVVLMVTGFVLYLAGRYRRARA